MGFSTIANADIDAKSGYKTGVLMTPLRNNADHSKTAYRRKNANESVNNLIVVQDDDHLFFTIANGETWHYKFHIKASLKAASDIRIAIAAPAGAGDSVIRVYREFATPLVVTYTRTSVVPFSRTITIPADADYLVTISGHYVATATGTFKLQWAQSVAVAHDFPLFHLGYSYVIAHRTAWP